MSWWWDGNYGFQVYSNESLENNPQSSGVQEVNWEEVSSDVYSNQRNFQSREQLVDWAIQRGRENGYILVTRRSRRKGDDPTEPFIKVWLVCDRHGERASTATVRRAGSKKIGCPFKLEGEYQENTGDWKLTVKDDSHNHDPSQHLEAHSFARRLSQSEQLLVGKLYSQNMLPRNILATIREQNPESSCIKKDIYNAKQKIKKETRVGETPMQILKNLFFSKKYVYYTREDPATNIVEEIFFVHQKSYKMWRAFPHVLMIDATYKTNMYKLPFVQVVGVTSTHHSFCVAHTFISKEREENFVSVLLQIKAMLLSVWSRMASFTDEDWTNFKYSWLVLCESPMLDIYQYNFNRIYERLYAAKRGRVIDYVTKNWLDPYKENFVSAWSNRNLNFGQHITNRVKSQHSLLKSYLRNANSSLDRLVGFVDEIVSDQYYQLQFGFGTSLIRKMDSHIAIELFDNLHGKVSHKALDLLENEWYKLSHIRKQNATCGCQLFSSCGLPCACRLANIEATGGIIPLDAVDVFRRKLDLKPSFFDDENVDVDKVLGQVRNKIMSQPDQVKRSMLSRIAGVVFPSKSNKKASVVQEDTRGRPTLKKQQQRKQDVVRNSSFIGSQQSKCDPTKHNSYIASQESIQASSVIQHRRSTKGKGKQPQDDNAHLGFPFIMGKNAVNTINCFKDSIPSLFYPYISHIHDVNPDGNCGFRSVALGLGLNEKRWLFIRQQLLHEMDNKEEWWRTVFDRVAFQEYDRLRQTID
ncbi:hypothetical protein L1987_64033 [Smallanthus sonchifolius]|uniref:Uncharacterized protein n=1 Tax=Smallanthus sonchifolius TaxID=185202 RepID=A0ACB9CEW1_9ASTR|nr:hypothetical protein L1987_64033 [Smallanthus sonchifolius]